VAAYEKAPRRVDKVRQELLEYRARLITRKIGRMVLYVSETEGRPCSHAIDYLMTLWIDQEAQRAPSSRGLPVKTLDGQLTYQHPKQRKQLRGDGGDNDGDGGDAAEAGVAGMIRVAGVTIEDDLEEHLRAEAEAGKRAIEESAREERERKAEDQRRKAEEQEGGLPSSEYHWVANLVSCFHLSLICRFPLH